MPRQGLPIGTAQRLAERMAATAVLVREAVHRIAVRERGSGPLAGLCEEVGRRLGTDVDEATFADMCAQTLVYGMLTARLSDPEAFAAAPMLAAVTSSDPLLAALSEQLHEQLHERAVGNDRDDAGLLGFVADLEATDVGAVLDRSGPLDGGDPVIHFYEEFLERYDPRTRADAGVFATPLPVVAVMVRFVDHVLRERFGLADGLADGSSWKDVSARLGTDVPAGVDPASPFVRMVDPATGTGTFVVEWLRRARLSFLSGNPDRDWPAHLRQVVLPSVHAFERMLAPYAVAHLKVALEARTQGIADAEVAIHLTDTLTTEGGCFTVAIGNPPYDRIARGHGGGWVAEAGPGGHALFDDVLEPARSHTIFSHQASLYNLYVYFWRWTLWTVLEADGAGPGVVTFVTASSWLAGPGFVGLRQLVRELADEVWVVDLGGDNKGARTEENVFDIETPVAITTIVRSGRQDRTTPARVRYRRVTGTRNGKLDALRHLDLDLASGEWLAAPTGWHDPLVPVAGGQDWLDHPALVDLFPWQQPGCMVNRTWPIAPDPDLLVQRWERLLASSDDVDRARCYVTPRSGRTIHTSVMGFARLVDLPRGAGHEPIVRYGLRSFDRQWTFEDPRLAKTESPSLWLSRSPRQVFLTSMVTDRLGAGPAATVTTAVPDKHHYSGRGGKDVFPLYRDASGTANVAPQALETITAAHGRAVSAAPAVTHERLFAYCYAVLAGADYTTRFARELETPGPRVPLTADPVLFGEAADHGEALLWLHTYGERFRGGSRPGRVRIDGRLRWLRPVDRIPETGRDVTFDEASGELRIGDGALAGVDRDVWRFQVGGMQVVKKWLGYRTRKGAGRATRSHSPLDRIRPSGWHPDWTRELLELITVLRRTLEALPHGTALLERICQGPLVKAGDLPPVPAGVRKPPAG